METGMIKADQIFGVETYEKSFERSQELAKSLMTYVSHANKAKEKSGSVTIKGNEYLCVDSWKYIGAQLGLLADIASCDEISPGIWKAHAKLKKISNGMEVASAFGVCDAKEEKNGTRMFASPHATASMAQTRAISKVFQDTIGYIPKLAGFSATPAEDMMSQTEETLAVTDKELKEQAYKKVTQDSAFKTGVLEFMYKKYGIKKFSELNMIVIKEINERFETFKKAILDDFNKSGGVGQQTMATYEGMPYRITDLGGENYILEKLVPNSDVIEAEYKVVYGSIPLCSCPGYLRSKDKKCKHISMITMLKSAKKI